MHKVFISYHHDNDQYYKNHLIGMNYQNDIFIDTSVQTDDISDDLPPQQIRRIIRDERLRSSTVTILLCGTETQYRKHIDWELKSSMIDGSKNKKSGILIIDLPTTSSTSWHTSHESEKKAIYPEYNGGWTSIETKSEYQTKYPEMPERILDNLLKPEANISVVPWETISNDPKKLAWLIKATANSRTSNQYDLSLPMRMRDHYPNNAF